MTEKYILVSDDEYCYTLDTSDENYKTLEDFEKQEFENAKHDGIDIKDYEEVILESANDKYWDWVYTNHLEADTVNDILDNLADENEQLKIKLEDIALEMENAKESNDDAQYELYKIKKKNEQLKKGMIEVVDRYIRNVEHNPPSSAHTYMKIKGALLNIREDLRDLIGDLDG